MGVRMKLLRKLNEGERLAPQAQIIYDVMLEIGVGKEVERADVVAKIEQGGKIVTRQPVDRIVSYYMQQFKKEGLMETIKPEPKPKAEKPAKDASPAAAAPKPEKAA